MENPSLEQEIADIEQRLAEKKAELAKPAMPDGRQELNEVVKEKIQEKVPEYQPSPIQPASGSNSSTAIDPLVATTPTADSPSYLSEELQVKIQELVDLAFTKSIEDAVRAASKLNNPALIDAFHDILVDQLYNTLIERGKLKKL